MKASKSFLEKGFVMTQNNRILIYEKELLPQVEKAYVIFYKDSEQWEAYRKNEYKGVVTITKMHIRVELHVIITKQMSELGWLYDREKNKGLL